MNKTKRTETEQQELLAYLRERYEYMPDKGLLRHKDHDKPPKPCKVRSNGYLELRVRWKGNVIHVAFHHAVWAVCKGRWPVGTIDHINGDPTENHIENLRECSLGDNHLNKELVWKINEDTGVVGVGLHKSPFFDVLYQTVLRAKRSYFHNPHQAFWIAALCGKRYRSVGE